jgi:hypothetical protein
VATDRDPKQPTQNAVGLCATCVHARGIESQRGSVFWLCQLSASDPSFPKYPRLPVLSCPGYDPQSTTVEDDGQQS